MCGTEMVLPSVLEKAVREAVSLMRKVPCAVRRGVCVTDIMGAYMDVCLLCVK